MTIEQARKLRKGDKVRLIGTDRIGEVLYDMTHQLIDVGGLYVDVKFPNGNAYGHYRALFHHQIEIAP